MKIITNVKPVMITAPTKRALIEECQRRFGLVFCQNGTSRGWRRHEFGRRGVQEECWYGINMEKRRRKRKSNDAHWVAWVYEIPMNCGVEQLERRFRLLTPSNMYALHRPTFKLSQ